MEFPTQKFISNFVENQFPDFYKTEGPNFIYFVQAYYEWLEQQEDPSIGLNPVAGARNLFDYRDIDNTLEQFLVHFQKKYLYGIPFNVIINKRILLKHVLDVYRSKGSIQGYALLFKLIYNQDIDVYLPRNDILKPSDGTWTQPLYIEVSDNGNLNNLLGKTVIGLQTKTTAVVENIIKQKVNNGIICNLYLSNLNPPSFSFEIGESIVDVDNNNQITVSNSPVVLGSLKSLNLTFGGSDFNLGDILKISDHDLDTNVVNSYGIDGLVKITGLTSTKGNIKFNINNGGHGYKINSDVFLYSNDQNIVPASFSVDNVSYQQTIRYNTDILIDYLSKSINSVYGFSGYPNANLVSKISDSLSFQNSIFGSISSLSTISSGNNYITSPNIFIYSTIQSQNLPGTISYSNTSNIVTGNSTIFSSVFTSNSVIVLVANSTYSEKQIVKQVVNDTNLILYGNTNVSKTNVNYKVASAIFPSNFTNFSNNYYNIDGSINGLNANIVGIPSYGNNNAGKVEVVSSGKGYVEGEFIKAYLYNSISNVQIIAAGNNYSNGDTINFIGITNSYLQGYVTTDNNGSITNVVYSRGSNLNNVPSLTINTNNGVGGILKAVITKYDKSKLISGTVTKSGLGKQLGFWTTSRGFLNSDKYIQDSYFYQDFSYQIKAANALETYKTILYKTFHPAGAEMFGQYYTIDEIKTNSTILQEV